MFMSDTFKTEIVTITPQVAEEPLKQNTKNRPISETNYKKILESMKSGEWELNGESIKIAKTGRVLDGQHRLKASADSGVTFTTLIVYGLEDDSQNTIGTGAARSTAHILGMNGYTNVTNLSAIVTAIIRSERWNIRVAVRGAGTQPVTAKQVLDRLESEPELVNLMNWAIRNRTRMGIPVRTLGLLNYIFSNINKEDADYFFDKLATGGNLKDGDPILTLRNTLASLNVSQRNKVSAVYVAALVIKAWNKFRDGDNDTMLLRFVQGGANPEKFPEPH